mmetsp:Transcript_119724/g.382138  ORF Transcript_119724/g.382138 Transcript_119724/m.382138 type:complete len:471 (-) Transcript_119724:353-1765(-)
MARHRGGAERLPAPAARQRPLAARLHVGDRGRGRRAAGARGPGRDARRLRVRDADPHGSVDVPDPAPHRADPVGPVLDLHWLLAGAAVPVPAPGFYARSAHDARRGLRRALLPLLAGGAAVGGAELEDASSADDPRLPRLVRARRGLCQGPLPDPRGRHERGTALRRSLDVGLRLKRGEGLHASGEPLQLRVPRPGAAEAHLAGHLLAGPPPEPTAARLGRPAGQRRSGHRLRCGAGGQGTGASVWLVAKGHRLPGPERPQRRQLQRHARHHAWALGPERQREDDDHPVHHRRGAPLRGQCGHQRAIQGRLRRPVPPGDVHQWGPHRRGEPLLLRLFAGCCGSRGGALRGADLGGDAPEGQEGLDAGHPQWRHAPAPRRGLRHDRFAGCDNPRRAHDGPGSDHPTRNLDHHPRDHGRGWMLPPDHAHARRGRGAVPPARDPHHWPEGRRGHRAAAQAAVWRRLPAECRQQ